MYYVIARTPKDRIGEPTAEEFYVIDSWLFRDLFGGDEEAQHENSTDITEVVDKFIHLDHAYECCDKLYLMARSIV